MKNDKKIRLTGFLSGRITIGNIRIIIGALFLILFFIIILYHLYFEDDIAASEEELEGIPKISEIESRAFFDESTVDEILLNHPNQIINYSTIEFHNPSILKIRNNHFLMAFEVRIDQNPSIWLMETTDGKSWSPPWHLGINLPDLSIPNLEYTQSKDIIISYYSGGNRYMQTSKTGHTWSLPITWEHPQIDEAVYYGKHSIIAANQTGLWLTKVSGDINWQQVFNESFENPSILMKNEYKFQIISEDAKNNYESLKITDLNLIEPEDKGTDIKWGLLTIFIILGIIILAILVNEVARE